MNKPKQPLVSIITPCYNGEIFVHRFLDSILIQTYENIEFIFINDGSNDNTEKIVLSYRDKFKLKGISFKYIFQENKGQAAALNKGLKICKGDYITWPDSDDTLHKDNVKDRVEFLEMNREFNIVLCQCIILDEDYNKLGIFKRTPLENNDNLFYDLIIEKNAYFAGGAYMIRNSAFLKCNPKQSIYESRGGQNWQMLLPVLYNNECGYLNRGLYNIFFREGSHSRQSENFECLISKCNVHEDILINTIMEIAEMTFREKEYYLEIVKTKYIKKRLNIAFQYRNQSFFKKKYILLKEKKQLKLKEILFDIIINNFILFKIFKFIYH